MKILYISSENVPGNVGGSVRTFEMSKALTALGHDVTIFTNRGSKQKKNETIEGVKIIRSRIKFGKTIPALGIKRLDIFNKDFDVILERYSIFGGIGTLYSKIRAKPLILEINAPHLEELVATNALTGKLVIHAAKRWRNVQFRAAKRIITTKKSLSKGYESKTIEITLGGVNIKLFNPKVRKSVKAVSIRGNYANDFLVVFHGAFTKWHGILDLLKAAEIVGRKDEKIKFILIGSGELEKKAKLLAPTNCIFLGKKTYSDIPYYLAACDVGVAPFGKLPLHVKKIGFYWTPMKIFEYISLGLPVVTADYPELRKIITNGIFYKPGDHKDLANAILKIKSVKRHSKSIDEYSWDNQAKKMDRILKEVV